MIGSKFIKNAISGIKQEAKKVYTEYKEDKKADEDAKMAYKKAIRIEKVKAAERQAKKDAKLAVREMGTQPSRLKKVFSAIRKNREERTKKGGYLPMYR